VSTRRPRIIVADDSPDDRYLIQMVFDHGELQAEVEFVTDGDELIQLLKGKAGGGDPLPDLVLLDLNMPRMGGADALKEIRRSPELQGIPIVVLTTSSATDDINTTQALDANGFLTKPSDFNEYLEIFSRLTDYMGEVVASDESREQGSNRSWRFSALAKGGLGASFTERFRA
jgi:two-component system, response regulator